MSIIIIISIIMVCIIIMGKLTNTTRSCIDISV